MKKLVMKIALPGAILAFAMALFGGSAYAYENFTKWQDTDKDKYIQGTKSYIDTLAGRIVTLNKKIDELKTQKSANDEELKRLQDVDTTNQSLQIQLTAKTQEVEQKKGELEQKKGELERKDQEIQTKIAEIQAKVAEIETKKREKEVEVGGAHNNELDAAVRDMESLQTYAKGIVDRDEHQVK